MKKLCANCALFHRHLPLWIKRARDDGWTESDAELRAKIENTPGCVLWEEEK